MKLTTPTDFDILKALSDGKRNNAVNLAHELDKNRAYVNTRLPILADYGLVERVGPAPNSGLYAITEKGRAVLENRSKYREEDVDFDAAVEETLESRSDAE
ncbi:winged helix-turn-helix domain-containing protein [Halorussus limi]|uniref:Winged helix-turn-helix domain-containing protein n=1 Tax=Halorussus limi TaxID=2938695 RepID=A0A8U0HWZ8_9EURY|nr:winged helix-turn-helix domain-containing protein [Halorussus limi]UPV75645.1 winged helix-turn-helix domain-containing protein [Halorussus limi]